MKLSSITAILVVALSLIVSVDQTTAIDCFEHNPLNFHDRTPVKCPMVNESSQKRKRQNTQIPSPNCFEHNPLNFHDRTPVKCPMVNESSQKRKRQSNSGNNSMFQISFACGISDTTLCRKVKTAFQTAGGMITNTLLLNTPITVNATFMNFCSSMGQCGSPEGFLTLGGAAPARTIPMMDKDGKQRFYPQALAKQFGHTNHPQFGQFDIVAMFNSVPNFWFSSDGPIGADQSDFLFVVLHELIHGLGFTSSWDDYINEVPQALTPDLSQGVTNGKVQFQFFEYAFDQYMVIGPQAKKATDLATQINQYSNGAGAKTQNINTFALNFEESTQYATAQQMFSFGTTRNSLGFMPENTTNFQNSVILETSLVPYQQGSSISHVDYNTYTNTSDFLMRFLQDRGVSLDAAIAAGGNYPGGAIGPKLKSVLETMGYATQENPNPYVPTEGTVSATTNPSSSSSTITRYLSGFETKLGFLTVITAVIWFIS